MSPMPPVYHAECPYGLVRRRCRRGRLKFVPKKVSQTAKVEMTYWIRAQGTKPCGYPSKRCHGAHRPRRRRDRIKIIPVTFKIKRMSDKIAQEDESTYHRRAHIAQLPANDPKPSYRVIGLVRRRRRHGWIEIERINDNPAQNDETTHLKRASAAQPPVVDSIRAYGVIGSRRQRGCIKLQPTNIS